MNGISWEVLLNRLQEAWEDLSSGFLAPAPAETALSFLRLTRPVESFGGNDLLAPIVGLAGVLTGLLAAGVALAALGTLLTSLLVLGFVLTEIFGLSIEMNGAGPSV